MPVLSRGNGQRVVVVIVAQDRSWEEVGDEALAAVGTLTFPQP